MRGFQLSIRIASSPSAFSLVFCSRALSQLAHQAGVASFSPALHRDLLLKKSVINSKSDRAWESTLPMTRTLSLARVVVMEARGPATGFGAVPVSAAVRYRIPFQNNPTSASFA
jgi:hypothetical protein